MTPETLFLEDTLTGETKTFSKTTQTSVNIYICGVTPYDFSHIGHGRSYINFDVLIRTLKFIGIKPVYARNFTDIDDKLLDKAQKAYGDSMMYGKVAQIYIDDFKTQTKTLNCLEPDFEPKATQCIDSMITLIEKLLEQGFAYKSSDDIFFEVSKFKEYGKLSKKDLDKQQVGKRISVSDDKKNPFDFVLWKGNSENKFWQAPFGWGRPGWHIECSAMIHQIFGEKLDIHGGGADLLFPHHENEIAQSESAYKSNLANCWLHNGLLMIKEEKMSKSQGNQLSMQNFFQHINPSDFRFYILQHHYRSAIDFDANQLLESSKAKEKLVALKWSDSNTDINNQSCDEIQTQIRQALLDDLNTAKALGIIFRHLELAKNNNSFKQFVIHFVEEVLGVTLDKKTVAITPEIQDLLEQRTLARQNKDWALADKLRDELLKKGYQVKDEKLKT